MQFRVLGEIAVVDDDGAVTPITANKPRALLAMLVLNANRSMSYPTLAAALWGDAQPEVPYAALQVVVSRLRSRLGQYGDRVQAHAGGYRIAVDPMEADFLVAQELLQEGRAALSKDDAPRAATIFERALALWSADALEDLSDIPFAGDAARRLRELWLDLIEARNDAVLRAGRHLEVLSNIDALVAAEPLREHLRAQQVAALYRAGRQAEALRACEALRNALRDELGVGPSPEMVELERRVLDQDPTLLPTEAGFMTPLPAWTVEALPFVGRGAEYRQVLEALGEAIEHELRYVLVEGPAGAGKSRFMLQVARRMAENAIVLPIHVHDVFSPAIYAFARVLSEATLRLSDDELAVVVSNMPNVPGNVASVRRFSAEIAAGRPPQQVVREEDLIQGAARWIAELSAKAPVVLVVDDLDTAGYALLHVIWQLAVVDTPKRVLVVGSARPDRMPMSPLAQTLRVLDRHELLSRISMPELGTREIQELLDRMHVERFADLAEPLHELTGGNAFLLAETLSMGSPEEVIERWTVPPQLRDVMQQRVSELGRATTELLMIACLFSRDFSVDVLADATGASAATVASLVDRAVAAHVLQPSTLRTYRFAHQLFRHALVALQPASARAAGHRQIALALERADATPSELAMHWNASEGPDVSAKIAHYARAAGRDALRLYEPNDAVTWFELAVEHLPEPERGRGLAELAEAQQLVGDPRGHENMQEAATIALATHDDDLIVQIIRATAPGWSALPRADNQQTHRLLDRAMEVVHDDATRARIMARQALELSLFDSEAAGARSAEAVALARQTGDRSALYETLLRLVSVAQSPHTLAVRQAGLREMAAIGSPAADVATRYFSLSAGIVAAIQAGDTTDIDQQCAEADALAGSYDLAPMHWSSMARRAWRVALAGDLDRAERLIEDARTFGEKCAIVGSKETSFIQRGELRWQQGRLAEMLNLSRAVFEASAGVVPGIALVLVRVLCERADLHDEARALVSELGIDRFEALQLGPFWSSALVITAESALILDVPAVSRTIRDLLAPFADQVAFTGTWVTAPIAYGLGVAMIGCGDPEAPAMLDRAAEIAGRLGAPVLARMAREAPGALRV